MNVCTISTRPFKKTNHAQSSLGMSAQDQCCMNHLSYGKRPDLPLIIIHILVLTHSS